MSHRISVSTFFMTFFFLNSDQKKSAAKLFFKSQLFFGQVAGKKSGQIVPFNKGLQRNVSQVAILRFFKSLWHGIPKGPTVFELPPVPSCPPGSAKWRSIKCFVMFRCHFLVLKVCMSMDVMLHLISSIKFYFLILFFRQLTVCAMILICHCGFDIPIYSSLSATGFLLPVFWQRHKRPNLTQQNILHVTFKTNCSNSISKGVMKATISMSEGTFIWESLGSNNMQK